jgi:hypothetical protein
VPLELLEELVESLESLDSLESLVASLGSLELGSVLVCSTSPPGDVYWFMHAQGEPPIRVIQNRERNVI